jgi:hypothetical protein
MIDRSIRRTALVIGAMAIIASMGACATPTPYQPYRGESAAGTHGGYSDQRLAPDRFRVRFHGNDLTSRERVESYLLYRAAELTLASGYDWFAITDRHTEHDVETYVRRTPWGAYGYWQPHWRYYRYGYGWDVWHPEFGGPFWTNSIDVTTVESFEVEAEIVLEKGASPAADPKAFDARRIISELGPTIERPKQS